jgi:glycosyltransferase involved in cell wall biosynthesis
MFLSVVLPVYNQEKYLKNAIKSILNQSYGGFELLILNDGSIDKSQSIIDSFADKRIRLFKNKKNQGLAKGLNFLISKARGSYIARMDGDDVSNKNRLKKQIDYLKRHQQTALLGTWARIINKNNRIIGKIEYPTKADKIRKKILCDNLFVHPSVIFKKDTFNKLGRYNEKLKYSQDYDLFLRFAVQHGCVNLPDYLIDFRWDPDFNKQREQHRAALQTRIRAVKEYGYSPLELLKLVLPAVKYIIPTKIKRFYWKVSLNEKV